MVGNDTFITGPDDDVVGNGTLFLVLMMVWGESGGGTLSLVLMVVWREITPHPLF